MAKKRKLSKAESTPISNPESGSQPESELASQPDPEPEPMVEETPIKEEPINEQQQPEEEGEGQDHQQPPAAEVLVKEEEEKVEEAEPQTLENSDPTPDAVNGVGIIENQEEEEEEEKDPSSIQKVLELFPKEQLVELLRDAAGVHPDVLSSIHRVADVDPAHRKIFVHGLGWDTSAETLRNAFCQYGEIEDCNAISDKYTGKSKGYGFILFKHRKAAQNALKEPQKKIGMRMTACQLASAGPVPAPGPPVSEYTQRKIYISNVGADIDPQKLLQFFSKYGEVEEGPLGLDKATGKPKGFCLFVYKSVESARKALEEPHKTFDGHVLHCQKAVDGPKGTKQFQFHHGHGGPRPNAGFVSGGAPSVAAAAAAPVGHLMAPSGFNQAVPASGLTPSLGQALTALLANQGAAGLGLNLLGGLGSAAGGSQGAPMGNAGMQGGYGNQNFGGGGGYGAYQAHGGYGNLQGRGQQGYGGRPPYMG